MTGVIKQIEKMKPFFEKVSRNIYLRAVRDGFIAAMPVVLFSSLFVLVALFLIFLDLNGLKKLKMQL